MEQETFEDEEAAAMLNDAFICIKVDREERPDIDAVYMSVCQALTGSGGWPLTILITPEQKPFWAGTYLPKQSKYGAIGIMELASKVNQMWKESREDILRTGEKITEFAKKQSEIFRPDKEPTKELLSAGIKQFYSSYDRKYGGFSSAPKFPSPHNLLFLMEYYKVQNDKSLLDMVEKTLNQMYRGGIFDHIGGGFSRYSTDEMWLIPHFEKMLYDNALLTIAYLEAYEITNNELYRFVSDRTLHYIMKELTDKAGGFYCGQDADSEGVEGKFYALKSEEVMHVLGDVKGEKFCQRYCFTKEGNFEEKNIPNLLSLKDNQMVPDEEMKQSLKSMYQYRLRRMKLHKDDKVLTSWNALAIKAFAKGYRTTLCEQYLETAKKAVEFILEHMTEKGNELYIRWRENEKAHKGQLDDYAFFADALISMYESTYDITYLEHAVKFTEKLVTLFFDSEQGGCFLYGKDEKELISRPKELYDGAIPSGNSVTAILFQQIFSYTGEVEWREKAEKQLGFIAGNISDYPAGYSMSLIGATKYLYPGMNLVCTTKSDIPNETLLRIKREYRGTLHIIALTQQNRERLIKVAPYLTDYKIPAQGELYYLCKNGACMAPVMHIEEVEKLLN